MMVTPAPSAMNLPSHPTLNRLFRLQYEEAQKTHVLLYPEGMVKLNQSASEILLLCDGSRTVEDIIATLEAKFTTSNLGKDITSMLEEAQRRNWIE
ncbi:pyrroloquinoline quinone biosynthesis peptide chaperone PqqD [Limnobacter humi]|uniref:Pyrroloquinoline quinone biosynthesis peptide chaperone PqqD n=1 Tax=Limnobacter humi TaxID=1778671 RepID=A0ABT1WGQ4_9BURK|nr:pyrroloquinoline quinone biosynthesis peptide chaperone PqqD [Limnobacter humi]MCQ8896660.1 pyrroloquinoline quinone biosynthesis peptide chaperone PqqD [Limnobacter humi]